MRVFNILKKNRTMQLSEGYCLEFLVGIFIPTVSSTSVKTVQNAGFEKQLYFCTIVQK